MLNMVTGLPGSGKSYSLVNVFLVDFLINSKRTIYTNLPINVEELASYILRTHYRKTDKTTFKRELFIDAIKARFIFCSNRLEEALDREGKPVLDDDQKPVGRRHMLKEFWWFTPSNCLVLLDEAINFFSSRDFNEQSGTKLRAYFTQQRHFKDDIYLIAQHISMVSTDLQKLSTFHYNCSNSLNENMFQTKWAAGITWPLQFFFFRRYVRRINGWELMNEQKVWPNKQGFKTYDSFSKPETLKGKELPTIEAESEDVPSFKNRFRRIWKSCGKLFSFFCVTAGVVLGFLLVAYKFQDMAKPKPKPEAVHKKETVTYEKKPVPPSAPPVAALVTPPSPSPPASDKVRSVGPRGVWTVSGKFYSLDQLPVDLVEQVRPQLERIQKNLTNRKNSLGPPLK